jgi:hypothetical protein
MCECTPEIRTPFCGRGDCLPPASREPTESLFAVNAEQAALNWAHNYAAKHQPRGSDSDADIAHLIVEQTKRIAELTIENGHLHIQLRQAEARETALRESLEEIERIVTTTGGPQLHMIMKIRDAIARALSGEGRPT